MEEDLNGVWKMGSMWILRRNQGIGYMGSDHERRWKVESIACALDLKS